MLQDTNETGDVVWEYIRGEGAVSAELADNSLCRW